MREERDERERGEREMIHMTTFDNLYFETSKKSCYCTLSSEAEFCDQ